MAKTPHPRRRQKRHESSFQHYVPEFLIRKWSQRTGKVSVWYWSDSTLKCESLPPSDIFGEHGLYADTLTADQDAFERAMNTDVESPAARVLSKILTDVTSLSDQERVCWSKFLLLLIARNPQRLRLLGQLNDDRNCSIAWIVCNKIFQETLNNSSWTVVRKVPGLLLGSNPVIWSGKIYGGNFQMYLPVHPDCLFVASNLDGFLMSDGSEINRAIFGQPQRYVIGETTDQFLQKHWYPHLQSPIGL